MGLRKWPRSQDAEGESETLGSPRMSQAAKAQRMGGRGWERVQGEGEAGTPCWGARAGSLDMNGGM